jgi:hypothetical protein
VRLNPACFAHVVPGLEVLAASELRDIGCDVGDTITRIDRRDSLLLFDAPDRARLLRSALVEDVFRTLFDVATPAGRRGPALLARHLTRPTLEDALRDHHALAPKRGGRSFRVVARMAGRHPFRREEVAGAVTRAVGTLLPHWVPAPDAAVEVWVHVAGVRTLCGLRLSTDALAQRRYKRAHRPGSLKPTVARALALWSAPAPGDVVIDPMAGAGTVLRERADAGRARLIAGGDVDRDALGAACVNAGRAAALALWDATRLPLRSGSVDALISNPPYGRQHDAPGGTARFYRALMREAARVLRSGGRCVVLTGDPDAMAGAVPPALLVRARHRLLVRGLPATAFVLERR